MQHTLATMFFERTVVDADAPAVQFKEGKGAYQTMVWKDYGVMVKQLAFGLAYLGLQPKSCVAIFAPNSHLWVAADLATISNGGISVPIYPTSSQSDIEFILSNSETKIVFVYNEAMLKKVLALRAQLPELKRLVLMRPLDSKTMSQIMAEHGLERERTEGMIVHFNEVLKAGANMQLEKPELLDERMKQARPEDVATIIYTSGTTGVPKGAEITHANLKAIVTDIQKVIPITKQELYLSYLPLSHVFERVCGEVYWIHYGGICAFAESIETMAKNLGETEPTMLLVVPRVLDRIYAKVKSGIDGASGRRRDLIQWALGVGKEYVHTVAEGKSPRPALLLKHWLSEKLVFQKMRQKIAPRLRLIVSGGAPATPSVLEFFNAIGVNTLEGW
ncbi:MAG TPA: AMP-binding protein, partial [Chroococcales cyanobacterium]